MKFKKGDKVRFLNDVGGGVVVRIIDKKMVEVLNDDDFEVPVLASELVKISSMEESVFSVSDEDDMEEDSLIFEEEETLAEPDKSSEVLYIEGNDELNIYMAIVPKEGKEKAFSVYLINDSNYQSHAIVSEKEFEQLSNIWNGDLESNRKQCLKTYSEKSLASFPVLNFQMLFYKFGKYELLEPLSKDISIHPQKFYKKGAFVENDYFTEDAMVIKLNDEDLQEAVTALSQDDIRKIKSDKKMGDDTADTLSQKFKVKKTNDSIREVDLHIHELLDDYRGMSNAEMLNVQMETFHKALNEGIKNHEVKKMVFIHGVGAGTLKNELRKSLTNDYPNLYFQDASFKEYGFGATLIILRRG